MRAALFARRRRGAERTLRARSALSIRDAVRHLLTDSSLVSIESLMLHTVRAYRRQDTDWCREYGLACEGQRWAEAAARAVRPGEQPVPVVLFVDGAELSRSGRHSARPVIMTLANLSLEAKSSRQGKVLLTYLPELHVRAVHLRA